MKFQNRSSLKIVSIIPARGGSKGILHKNTRPLLGQPLLAYAIQNARMSRYIQRVIVSTDSQKIADITKKYRAEVVWRPARISGDRASSESALLHALHYLRKKERYVSDLVVFLQCTSPVTLPEDIDGAIRALLNEGGDCSFTVSPFHHFLWRRNKKDSAIGINHDRRKRLVRQEREEQFIETGAVYVMRTEGFIKAKHRFFGKSVMHVIPRERCLEVDGPIDLSVAEVLLRKRTLKEKSGETTY